MKEEIKLCEATANIKGSTLRFRYANPRPLTAEQKTSIALAAIGAAAFLGFFLIVVSAVR